jgi:hypothetical protein
VRVVDRLLRPPLLASLWRRRRAQGPLEAVMGRAAGRARQAVLGSPAARVGAVDRE